MNIVMFKIHSACTLDYLCSFFPGVVNHGLLVPYIVTIFRFFFLIRRTKVIGKQQTHGELNFLFRSRASNQVGRGRAHVPHPNYLPTRKCVLNNGVKTRKLPPCHNSLATALLVDTYQITMAYAYWKNGTHARIAAFDLLFRKNPFNGEFTVFAGLEECLRFISNFRFTGADIAFLRR